MTTQSGGSHVHWPVGYDEANEEGTKESESIHRMNGTRRGASSSWNIRFPNDRFVADEAVTLDHMRELGAL